MILKFWPRWPQKRPLNLSSLGSRLIFITFHNRIFVVLSFEVFLPRRPQKEPSEYFQRLHFWNQWVPLIKTQYRVCYLLNFDLKLRSGQRWLLQLEDYTGYCPEAFVNPIMIIRSLPHFKMEIALLQTPFQKWKLQFELLLGVNFPRFWPEPTKIDDRFKFKAKPMRAAKYIQEASLLL